MRSLSKRLARLEAATAGLLEGPWLWPAKAAAVRKCTMEAMSPEEQVLLTESFGSQDLARRNEFIAMHSGVWARYLDAFERATREVPAPYVMSISDLWGSW
jgi:hypothetical protein